MTIHTYYFQCICSNTGTYLENVHVPYLCASRCPTVRYYNSYDYSSCSCSYSSGCCCKRHLLFVCHALQQFERSTVGCLLRVWHYSMQRSLLALPLVCCIYDYQYLCNIRIIMNYIKLFFIDQTFFEPKFIEINKPQAWNVKFETRIYSKT